jgi:hypothetical protein
MLLWLDKDGPYSDVVVSLLQLPESKCRKGRLLKI